MDGLSRTPNVIYVGRKPPMNYVLGIITSFSGSNTKEVTLKARGQAITTAIDSVEITRRRFMKELNIGARTASLKLGNVSNLHAKAFRLNAARKHEIMPLFS